MSCRTLLPLGIKSCKKHIVEFQNHGVDLLLIAPMARFQGEPVAMVLQTRHERRLDCAPGHDYLI